MDVELMLGLGARDLSERQATLLWSALRQLQLAKAAARVHREMMARGGITSTAAFASRGLHQEQTNGAFIATMLSDNPPSSEAEISRIVGEVGFPGAAAESAARACIYELAVFRNLMRAASKQVAERSAADAVVTAFDDEVPGLVAVRDTLAHLDERFSGEARGRAISPQTTTVQGEVMELGAVVEIDRISAHTASGQFVTVNIGDDTFTATRKAFRGMIALFPLATPIA